MRAKGEHKTRARLPEDAGSLGQYAGHLNASEADGQGPQPHDAPGFLQTVIDAIPQVTMVIDRDYRIVLANRAAREFAGGDDPAATRRTCYSVSHHRDTPCDEPEHPCPLEQVLRTKTPVTVEHAHHDVEGAEVFVEVTAGPVFDDAGEVGWIVMSRRDITERKKAIEAIRASEQEKALILNNTSEIISYHDRNHVIQWANRAYQDTAGLSLDELKGQTCYRAWGLDRVCNHCPVSNAIEGGQAREAELTPQNQEHWPADQGSWLVRADPVRDADGMIIGAIEVASDITERKQAADALRKAHDELEQRVKQRTIELATANRELEAFAYSVSHDLRAPLRGIDGFSAALLEEYSQTLDEKGRGYLARVRAAAGRMAELIDDLLGLSRIGQIEMACETVDLSALAEKIATDFQAAEPDRRVTFEIARGLTADGDSHLLRVMLDKLIENAWKFTSHHPVARVEFGVTEGGNEQAFFVRDDGAGFDMAYVGKLFGPFQRLHSIDEFPGTGIGLATAERIVHRHGGRIWAHGEVEKGATFYFTLPQKPDR